METVLFGQVNQNIYKVNSNQKDIEDSNGNLKTIYISKPSVEKIEKNKEWVELCRYKGAPKYNSKSVQSSIWSETFLYGRKHTVNISKDKTVTILDEIFRADLNRMELYTDEVVEIEDVNKEEALSECEKHVKAFNKMMIESNDKLMAYCNLHKLSYEDTDCFELFNLVFPNKKYEIIDGVMKVKDDTIVTITLNDSCIYDKSKLFAINCSDNTKVCKNTF